MNDAKFKEGDFVRKKKGSWWHGRVVGVYKTDLTVEGYAVESHFERGSVQIYPISALEPWTPTAAATSDEVARIVEWLREFAEERFADECERDSEVLHEAAAAIYRGAHREGV